MLCATATRSAASTGSVPGSQDSASRRVRVGLLIAGGKPPRGGEFGAMKSILKLSPDRFTPLVIYGKKNNVVDMAIDRGISTAVVSIDPVLLGMYPRQMRLWNPLLLIEVTWRLLRTGAVREISGLVVTHHIDVLYCSDNISKILGGLAARRAGIPVVGRCDDVAEGTVLGMILRLLNAIFLDRILAVSGAVRDSLLRSSRAGGKTLLLYNGVDPEVFDPARVRPVDCPESDGRLIVGCVGALDWNKGQGVLIDAVARLRDDGMDLYDVWLIGTGPSESALCKQAEERGIAHRVRFWGFRRDVPPLLRAMHVLVVPSLYIESQSIVAIEAMMMGLPVIGSRLGGVPEVISHGETGMLCPPGDATEIAAALRELAADPDTRERMGLNGRARALSMFSAQRLQQRLESMLLSIVNGVDVMAEVS